MWRRFKAESVTVRLIPFAFVMAAGVVTAYLGYQSFVTNLTNFLDVLRPGTGQHPMTPPRPGTGRNAARK